MIDHYEICTNLELKEFANQLKEFTRYNQKPTAFNFARWIEEKSNNKYILVEVALIKELFNVLNSSATSIYDKNNYIRSKYKNML